MFENRHSIQRTEGKPCNRSEKTGKAACTMYKQGLEFTGKLLHVYCSPRGRCAFHITMPCSFLIAYVNPNSLIAPPESKI